MRATSMRGHAGQLRLAQHGTLLLREDATAEQCPAIRCIAQWSVPEERNGRSSRIRAALIHTFGSGAPAQDRTLPATPRILNAQRINRPHMWSEPQAASGEQGTTAARKADCLLIRRVQQVFAAQREIDTGRPADGPAHRSIQGEVQGRVRW